VHGSERSLAHVEDLSVAFRERFCRKLRQRRSRLVFSGDTAHAEEPGRAGTERCVPAPSAKPFSILRPDVRPSPRSAVEREPARFSLTAYAGRVFGGRTACRQGRRFRKGVWGSTLCKGWPPRERTGRVASAGSRLHAVIGLGVRPSGRPDGRGPGPIPGDTGRQMPVRRLGSPDRRSIRPRAIACATLVFPSGTR
jgi:hypothetical protein